MRMQDSSSAPTSRQRALEPPLGDYWSRLSKALNQDPNRRHLESSQRRRTLREDTQDNDTETEMEENISTTGTSDSSGLEEAAL